jgi:hypothetical protein
MAMTIPGCRSVETASFWTRSNLVVDGFLLAQGGAAALLGLVGLRFVPMCLLAIGWKVGEYLVKACAPLSLVPSQTSLRPALLDLAVLMGGWLLGRLVRFLVRRRRTGLADSSLDLGAEVDFAPAARRRPRDPPPLREPPGQIPADLVSASAERSWTTPGAIVLELDEREAEALRAALDSRLTDLRRIADKPSPGNVRDEIWQTIATLESLLAHLPAGHLYDRGPAWSQSGHRL